MPAPALAVLFALATPAGGAAPAVPAPVEDDVRPVAPATHPWSDRSGALLSAGASASAAPSSSHGLAVVEARAGMHEYGLEWAVGGAIGPSFAAPREGGSGLAYEGVVAPGARIALGGRLAGVLRFTAGVLSLPGTQAGGGRDTRGTSIAFGGEAGVEVALGRALRIEARLSCRALTSADPHQPASLVGIGAGVVGIP